MKKVTAWSSYNKDTQEYRHNHIQNGWVEEDAPIPKTQIQNAWKNKTWKKEFCYLVDHKVVRKELV